MSIFSKFKDLFDKILFISKFTYVKNKNNPNPSFNSISKPISSFRHLNNNYLLLKYSHWGDKL